VVVKAIGSDGRGRVRVRGQIWSSLAFERLGEGTPVLVLGAERGCLVVGEAPEDLKPRLAACSGEEDPCSPS
jgi:membrane protein implicated in regulation of membrane protease activity